MALADSLYRIKIDMNYTNTSNATNATTAINNVLIGTGRPERAVRTSSNVYLLMVGLEYETANTIYNGLNAAWGSAARSGGKVSLVRSNDLD